MTGLAGLFLIAHGLAHLALWVTPPEDAPFDPSESWLLGDVGPVPRALAVLAFALFLPAGMLVLSGSRPGAVLAVAGATVSLLLVVLTFHRWFVFAVAINIAIIVIAVG
jgi:hypothetical protein